MTSPAPIAWIVPAGTKITSPGERAPPHDKVRDRAVVDGFAQLLRSHALLQAEGDLGLGSGTQDVPGLGFAVRQSDRLRIRIVGMDLDGKRLAREQQLEQERRIRGRSPGRSYQISPIVSPSWRASLQGRRSDNTPRLGQGMRARMFDSHRPDLMFGRAKLGT